MGAFDGELYALGYRFYTHREEEESFREALNVLGVAKWKVVLMYCSARLWNTLKGRE